MIMPLTLTLATAVVADGEYTCQSPQIRSLPFCDSSQPAEIRALDLIPRLNLSEAIGQTGMVASAVPHLGMKRYNFGGEALHGVWASCVTDNMSFPVRAAA